jgi:hypothetical protein
LLKSIADQAAEILTLRECVVTLKREVAALRAERDALRRVVAAADAMRTTFVAGRRHPDTCACVYCEYDAARAALKG